MSFVGLTAECEFELHNPRSGYIYDFRHTGTDVCGCIGYFQERQFLAKSLFSQPNVPFHHRFIGHCSLPQFPPFFKEIKTSGRFKKVNNIDERAYSHRLVTIRHGRNPSNIFSSGTKR